MKLIIKDKGFTLIEVLLVITLIGILIGIALVSINPNRQIGQVRNLNRKSHITDIYNALETYNSRNSGTNINSITTNYQEICDTGTRSITDTLPDANYCNGKLDLRVLVPTYITSIPRDTQAGTGNTGYEVAKTSDNQISIRSKNAELGESIVINNNNVVATGGTESTITVSGVNYKVHTFTTSGNFVVTNGGTVEVLIVGGGGGGGAYGGGGGAGGVAIKTSIVSAGNKTITVGNGGAGGSYTSGLDGSESSFNGLSAGGGGGGAYSDNIGRVGVNGITVGGSAGGCGRGTANPAAIAGVPLGNNIDIFNNSGGSCTNTGWESGSGGGGAGAPGYNGVPDSVTQTGTAAEGGIGIQSNISGTSTYYGGGGGGAWQTGSVRPDGGLGGGGRGANNGGLGENGTPNTGGGGGGGWNTGGNGGSGIVIIRYPI